MIKDFFLDKININVKNKPNTLALKDSEEEVSYGLLGRIIENLADSIRKVTRGANVPVVIYNRRGVDFVLNMLAVLKAGAFYIPLEKPIPIERVRDICRQTSPSLIITNEVMDELKFPQLVFDRAEYTEKKESCLDLKFERECDDLAYVIFTSGTTGVPKGVKISSGNLNNLIECFNDILYRELDYQVNIGVISSFGFDASVKMIFPALTYGHTLVIADKSVNNFGRKIHSFHVENNIFVSDGTPSHLKLMVLQKTKVYTTAKYFLVGGENLEYKTLRDFCEYIGREPVFINVYGPTECCVDISYKRLSSDEIHKGEGVVPIGHALSGNYLEIHDDNEIILENQRKGELWIRGNQVGMGYFDGESRGFVVNGNTGERCYRTGDIAMYNDNREIIVIGRTDRQVKIHGNRVELDEIAITLKTIADISDAEVLLTDLNGKDSLVAFVTVKEEANLDTMRWNRFLMDRLPKYMLITKYVIVDRLPLTERGKINRVALLGLLD